MSLRPGQMDYKRPGRPRAKLEEEREKRNKYEMVKRNIFI
jgi:hypothetical protein